MKKLFSKKLQIIFMSLLCIALVFMLCACGGNDNSEPLPTSEEVVAARAAVANANQQNYDFKLNLAGNVSVGAYSGTANANYDGKYRYDKTTGDLKFKRVTSGILLYDSTEYIYTSGSSKIKLVANENGVLKKSSVVLQQEEGLMLINRPFVAIVDALKADNVTDIKAVKGGEYKYVATIKLNSSNSTIQNAINTISNMGTSLTMRGVEFTNPTNGIKLYFNLSDGKMAGFSISADVKFPVKNSPVSITLTYKQSENNSDIAIPSTSSLITGSGIQSEMNTINNAILALKNSAAYSLDFEAVNDFDPGWNVRATVDKYIARMYKNTNNGRVDFNHSFKYKAHTEEEGKESFKYTIGNIQDGTVHQVSRRGSNTITALNSVNVNTQFNYLTAAATLSADKIDCIRKETSNGTTKYYVYMNKDQTMSVQRTISDILNSNTSDGVIPVENYFNSTSNSVRDAEMIIEIKNGVISSINVSTKIRYVPTGGSYTDENITLTNSISLKVNDNLTKAQKYEAPKDTDTHLGSYGLNNAKFYIL